MIYTRSILLTSIIIEMVLTLMVPQDDYFFIYQEKEKWIHLHQFALHIIDSALKRSVNHTHLGYTLTANRNTGVCSSS